MTSHAVCPEGQDVFRGKWLVDLQVTVGARSLIERRGVSFDVTIFAGEGCAV
jgi:hypothetical protein